MTSPLPPEDKEPDKTPDAAKTATVQTPQILPPEPRPEPHPTLLEAWRPVKNSEKSLNHLTFERGSFMASSVIGGGIGASLLGVAFYTATMVKAETPHQEHILHSGTVGLSLLAVPFIGLCILHAWFRKGVSAELERRKNNPPPVQNPKP